MNGTFENLEKERKKGITLILDEKAREELFTRIGYAVDEKGFLIDKKTKDRIKAEDGLEIPLAEEKQLALISGSHIFVRNVAGLSQVLAEKGELNVKTTEEE